MQDFIFETDCINSTGYLINEMRDVAVEVTFEEMLENCAGLLEWSKDAGFELHERLGLTLENDCAVSYHKSAYMGYACYYLVWSAIEQVWVDWDHAIETKEDLDEWLTEDNSPEMPTDYDRVLAFLEGFLPQLQADDYRIIEEGYPMESGEMFTIAVRDEDGCENYTCFFFNKDRQFQRVLPICIAG